MQAGSQALFARTRGECAPLEACSELQRPHWEETPPTLQDWRQKADGGVINCCLQRRLEKLLGWTGCITFQSLRDTSRHPQRPGACACVCVFRRRCLRASPVQEGGGLLR